MLTQPSSTENSWLAFPSSAEELNPTITHQMSGIYQGFHYIAFSVKPLKRRALILGSNPLRSRNLLLEVQLQRPGCAVIHGTITPTAHQWPRGILQGEVFQKQTLLHHKAASFQAERSLPISDVVLDKITLTKEKLYCQMNEKLCYSAVYAQHCSIKSFSSGIYFSVLEQHPVCMENSSQCGSWMGQLRGKEQPISSEPSHTTARTSPWLRNETQRSSASLHELWDIQTWQLNVHVVVLQGPHAQLDVALQEFHCF